MVRQLTHTPKKQKAVCPNPESEKVFGAGFHHLNYLEWGTPGDKGTVVCVHGFTRNAHDFDFLACDLVNEGFHVICPDVAGRGDSDYLSFSGMYNYGMYVADMLALFTQLGLCDVQWVGTSMGGLMGMMLESSNPFTIKRMVLNDIGPFIPKAALNRIGSYVGRNMVFDNRESAIAHMKAIHATFGLKHEYQWEHMFYTSYKQGDDGKWYAKYDPKIGDAFRTKTGKQIKMPDMDMWPMWEALNLPMLVLRGKESDLLLEKTAKQMARQDNVQLIEFADVGHAPMLMDEHQTEPVVRWLST